MLSVSTEFLSLQPKKGKKEIFLVQLVTLYKALEQIMSYHVVGQLLAGLHLVAFSHSSGLIYLYSNLGYEAILDYSETN